MQPAAAGEQVWIFPKGFCREHYVTKSWSNVLCQVLRSQVGF